MKYFAPFLLAIAASMGCVSDCHENGAVVLQYKRLFEVGRLAEYEGNVKIAEDTYGWLIRCGSHYGEYGLAMLLLRLYPERKEDAVRHFLACAKRSGYMFDSSPDTAMDSAFSAAAMAKLSDIAVSEYGRFDVADSLRCMLSRIVTDEVKAWVEVMRSNVDSATIYEDIISAVESNGQVCGCVKVLKWDEISMTLLNGKPQRAEGLAK